MGRKDRKYYAEISILVDGWPWNLSEFDFRRFFAEESCPHWLIPVAELDTTQKSRVSGNRRPRNAKAAANSERRKKQPHQQAHRQRLEALARAVLFTKAA